MYHSVCLNEGKPLKSEKVSANLRVTLYIQNILQTLYTLADCLVFVITDCHQMNYTIISC